MIKINENMEIKRDNYQWILTEWRDGFNEKTQKPTRNARTTYHATFEQVAGVVVERACGECESLEGLKALVTSCKLLLVEKLEEAGQ